MVMRVLGVIVIILGLVGIVFGIMFFPQASAGQDEIAVAVAPLTLDQVVDKYDEVTVKYDAVMAAEGPAIAAGTAYPSVTYAYLAGQRALLGLAKSNLGFVHFVQFMGAVSICLGAGLAVTGVVLVAKK
jgi:hypothetical protein